MPAPNRSQFQVTGFVAFLAIVMAFGIEAMLPAFDLVDERFGFSDRGLSVSLMVTTLLAGMGAGQLVWGPLADAYGRRPVLLAGLALYGLGAVGTATAPSLELVLVARVVWGLGAAAPNGLRLAVARDLFDGERMARVVTVATAVFLVGPVLMPIIGEGLLVLGDWQLIPYAGLVLGLAGVAATLWFGESLPPERRRSLRLGPTVGALAAIARTPAAAGAILAVTFFSGSFFVYLGSAQPIVDRIYGRDDQFIWFFAASGLTMASGLLLGNALLGRFGTARLAVASAVAYVGVSLVGLATGLASDGVPSVWTWLVWVCLWNAAGVVANSLTSALALDPLGDVAGTAASILAFAQLAVGSLLAALVDGFIDTTVLPMHVGAVAYSVLGCSCLVWSQRRRDAPAVVAVA